MLLAKTLRSSTFRLALFSIGIFGAVVIALFAYVYWSTAAFVLSRSDRAIAMERAMLRSVYDGTGRDGLARAIAQRIARDRQPGFKIPGDVILLADATFAPIVGNLKSWPAEGTDSGPWIEFRAETSGAGARPALYRASSETLPDGSHLLVGEDISELAQFAQHIWWAIIATIFFVFVLAAVAGVSVTRRTVGRIEAINATSRAIMASGLGERIPLRGTQDEWDQLARNLNAMLTRIEELMNEVKEVSDNVAHDLRTPLTRVRARLEKATIGPREPERDQALIGDTIADLDDVLRMFASLTRISQIEAARRTAGFRPVNLAALATEVAELFDPAAEDKGGHVEVLGNGPVMITGDRDLLFDAISNLVDNAIKHGGEAGTVTITVRRNSNGATIAVGEHGPGIPPEEFQQVFKRFYRREPSRGTPGNGLGLSLVAAVARLHGARIKLSDNAPGLVVALKFPAQGPASAFNSASSTRRPQSA